MSSPPNPPLPPEGDPVSVLIPRMVPVAEPYTTELERVQQQRAAILRDFLEKEHDFLHVTASESRLRALLIAEATYEAEDQILAEQEAQLRTEKLLHV